MKSIIKSSLLLCAGVALFSACNKDLDNNPTLQTPETFVLNTPAYAAQTIDLKVAEGLNFTWSQPEYGFPASAEYGMQFSATNKWTKSVDVDADNGNYAAVGSPTYTASVSVPTAELATAVQKLARYEENKVPSSQELYARVYSLLNGDTIYSNPVKLSVAPYYVELSDAPVETWYLVGGSFGDGSWGNSQVVPLLPMEGQEYDKKTGKGIISWTGYLSTSGFKLKKNPENWDAGQVGQGTGFGDFVYNDGGSKDIKVPEAGYYTITFDTKETKIKIEKYTGDKPSVYNSMALPGKHDGWKAAGGTPLTAQTSVVENHDWKGTVTFTEKSTGADGEGCKFAANGAWDANWGFATFPYGVGKAGGANIRNGKGTYVVYFNDITGQYSFVKQK